ILRAHSRRNRDAQQQAHGRNASHTQPSAHNVPQRAQPQSTDPPFTLMISPQRKLAKSDARNRIGPAISSAVAARPSGIAVAMALPPDLVLITGFDISVATQPGATEFTRMLCRASS